MSDEESGSEYEEEAPSTPKAKKPPAHHEPPQKEMSEGELMVMAAKKKMKEEEEKLYLEFMDMRKAEREKEEAALQSIRERQAERRKENAAEQERLEELRKQHAEARSAEEEEAQERREAEYNKRMAEKRRREQELANILGKTGPQSVQETTTKKTTHMYQGDENIGGMHGGVTRRRGPKHWVVMERRKTEVELEEEKKHLLEKKKPKIESVDRLDLDGLKKKAEDLQAKIVKLETEKYDMEQRMARQDYDLKELGERQKQQEKQKALKKGINPDEITESKHPQKISVSSKFDRQIDSRSYDDRKKVFCKEPTPPHEIIHVDGGGEDAPEQPPAEEEVAAEEE